jgi:hypothetical protein
MWRVAAQEKVSDICCFPGECSLYRRIPREDDSGRVGVLCLISVETSECSVGFPRNTPFIGELPPYFDVSSRPLPVIRIIDHTFIS